MGLAGARNSAVTSLLSQGTSLAIGADNIANVSTIGYKAIKGAFSTLVTSSGSGSSYSSGGVSITPQTLIEEQGLIESTGRVTDLAISGAGFFAVNDEAGTLLLTRAGSFSINNKGELVNTAGFKLVGWPLNNDGLLPGATGNTNTTAAESTDSLVVVDTNSASGTASATTSIKVGANLNAGQTTFQGATIVLDPASSANSTIAQGDIIVPGSGMQEGDSFTFSSNSVATTFTYGGFAKSKDISASATYGTTSPTTTFTTVGGDLAESDSFSITTSSGTTTTFEFVQSSPNTLLGQFNSLSSLATAINSIQGLTARVSGGILYVSSDVANDAITFADVTANSNIVAELGFSNEAAAATGINRFNTMSGLSELVALQDQLGSVINNATSGATIDIFSKDPLQTLVLTKAKTALTIDLQSDNNGNNTETDLIVPVETDGTSTMVPEITAAADTAGVASISFTDGTNTGTFSYGGIGATKAIGVGTEIFGASTALGGDYADTTDRFVDGTSGLDSGETITFNEAGGNALVVTFNDVATASLAAGEFNSLITLATAINTNANYSAKVANGKLYIASRNNANNSIAIASTTITGGALDGAALATEFGGNFVDNTADGTTIVPTRTAGNNLFATLAQLDTLIEGITNFTTVDPSGSNASIGVSIDTERQITVGGATNADLLKELGITSGTVSNGLYTEFGLTTTIAATVSTDAAAVVTATIPVTYDAGNVLKNMASGQVTPHFSRNMRVYDSLGTGHDFRLAFLKTGSNQWAVEFFSLEQSEISNDTNLDGLLASGTITFNGDGSLAAVDTSLTDALTIAWTTGSSATSLVFDLGTAGQPNGTVGAAVIGLTDGLRQFDSAYNVDFVEQNGVAAGQFSGIEVSEDGTVSAKFSNGQIKPIYQLPILTVANPNALSQKTGNVFAVTKASGEVNLTIAGQSGSGKVVPSALEGSTADITVELTKTIGTQSNYNAAARIMSTIKDMEDKLDQRI